MVSLSLLLSLTSLDSLELHFDFVDISMGFAFVTCQSNKSSFLFFDEFGVHTLAIATLNKILGVLPYNFSKVLRLICSMKDHFVFGTNVTYTTQFSLEVFEDMLVLTFQSIRL